MRNRVLNRIGALLLLTTPLVWGCTREILRISDGTSRQQRAIAPQAYAAFARGRLLELGGKRDAAVESYREVLRLDSGAAEAWTRIGVLNCKHDWSTARDAFRRAEERDSESASLFSAKANCALLHRDFEGATTAALSAMRIAPNDVETSLLQVQVQVARGNSGEALRYAWAHVAVFPNDTAGWLVLADLVGESGPLRSQVEKRAMEGKATRFPYMTLINSPKRAKPIDTARRARLDLEHALVVRDDRAAQRAARELRLGTLELLDVALELGNLDFAMAQATVAGQIAPNDPTIWQLRLMLADSLGIEDQFQQLLSHPPTPSSAVESTQWRHLIDVVKHRTGVDLLTPN